MPVLGAGSRITPEVAIDRHMKVQVMLQAQS